uniref:Uncharacterized protein n=1 Tax=Meloidogyne incognita TaxID=6306 RepID=A0A914MQC9_MELIC
MIYCLFYRLVESPLRNIDGGGVLRHIGNIGGGVLRQIASGVLLYNAVTNSPFHGLSSILSATNDGIAINIVENINILIMYFIFR